MGRQADAGTAKFKGYHITPESENWWDSQESPFYVRAACDVCNPGWMLDLDEAAEPLVEPFVLGMSGVLQPSEQEIVATWLTLVAILSDQQTRTAPARITSQEHEWFYVNRQPFPDSAIWLSRTRSSRMEFTASSIGWTTGEDLPPHTHGLNVRLGDFIARLFKKLRDPPAGFDFMNPAANPSDRFFFRKLWPPSFMPVSWPPPEYIPEELLDEFMRR